MHAAISGALLRQARLERNWSQEGLCRGICAVSYLSKIEQGKVEASGEILRQLFARLSLPWYDQELEPWQALVNESYEAVFSCDRAAYRRCRPKLEAALPQLRQSPLALDAAILEGLLLSPFTPAPAVLEPYFDRRQLALQRMMENRDEEALKLYPCAYLYLMAGIHAYEQGEAAVSLLEQAYDLAAAEGYAHAMLRAQLFLGNFYSNLLDYPHMDRHYTVAQRLAQALGDEGILRDIRYNRAATALELGRYEEAYAYLAAVEAPTVMELHKLSIACEKLGRRAEALEALDRAETLEIEYPEADLAREMCALVRFRLEDEDYLRNGDYGRLLLSLFDRCRRELPIGYAVFHLPWVAEWYTAARQYRAAYELLRDFPVKVPLPL